MCVDKFVGCRVVLQEGKACATLWAHYQGFESWKNHAIRVLDLDTNSPCLQACSKNRKEVASEQYKNRKEVASNQWNNSIEQFNGTTNGTIWWNNQRNKSTEPPWGLGNCWVGTQCIREMIAISGEHVLKLEYKIWIHNKRKTHWELWSRWAWPRRVYRLKDKKRSKHSKKGNFSWLEAPIMFDPQWSLQK